MPEPCEMQELEPLARVVTRKTMQIFLQTTTNHLIKSSLSVFLVLGFSSFSSNLVLVLSYLTADDEPLRFENG